MKRVKIKKCCGKMCEACCNTCNWFHFPEPDSKPWNVHGACVIDNGWHHGDDCCGKYEPDHR